MAAAEDVPVKKYFTQIMKMVDGVLAIAVTDREGIPVLLVKDDKLPPDAAKPRVLSSAALTFEQASKLGLGQTQNVTVFFTSHQMVCFNKMPLAVTVIADRKANTGHILSLEKEISNVVNAMKGIVDLPAMA